MKQSYEQVLQWFLEKQSGSLSPTESAELEKLLAEDPHFRSTWNTIGAAADEAAIQDFAASLDLQEGLQALKQRMQERAVLPARRTATSFKWVGMAAAALLLLTAGAWFMFLRSKPVSKEQAASLVQKQQQQAVRLALANGRSIDLGQSAGQQTIRLDNATLDASAGTLQYRSEDTTTNTLSVPAGKTYKLELSDGTEVWLNAATVLRFPFRFHNALREVHVEGEAFFKVAKNEKQPFIVHTPHTAVRVLGTSFNVNTYQPQQVRTSLVEGKVITRSREGQQQSLQPGEEATLTAGNKFIVSPFDEEEVTGWLHGRCYFHNMPVTEVARIASRIYGVNFILDQNKFQGKSITGVMDRNKLTEFLSDLETIAQSTYQISGKDLYLK